jgi:hypothetical protein
MYPVQLRYINKFSVILYGLFFLGPIHHSIYVGHFSWKRGKLPRLTHGDMKYQKFIMQRGTREKLLHTPALEWYPDVQNKKHERSIHTFFRKHKNM